MLFYYLLEESFITTLYILIFNFLLYLIRSGVYAKENITKLYPAAFEMLTYQNYKAKFHTLLFMEEIEVNIFYIFLKFYLFIFIKFNIPDNI